MSASDVVVLVGLLIDKFRYHLPLYRQHQRMQAAGLTISRWSLSNWVHRTIGLLEPIYHSQLYSILHSGVLAMDEKPIRAGRKSKGKMGTAYYWPIYGDQHEVAFPYAPSRAHDHANMILGECGSTWPPAISRRNVNLPFFTASILIDALRPGVGWELSTGVFYAMVLWQAIWLVYHVVRTVQFFNVVKGSAPV